MPYIFAKHKVQDYAKWKSAFDGAINMRQAGGEQSYQIFHLWDDANDLVLFFEWDNLDNAKQYFQSTELREAMQQAGVIGQPEIHITKPAAGS